MVNRFQIIIFSILILCCTTLHAQFRTYAGEFLKLGVGARSLAMGNTGATIAEDASAGYWNPAGLSQIQFPSIVGMHEARFDNTVSHDFAALAFPLGSSGGASISVMHIGISNIKDTRSALIDANGNGQFDEGDYLDYSKVSSFGNYDWGFLFSYGQAHDSILSFGATAKFILRKLDPTNHATGFGFDVGFRYMLLPELTLGAIAEDITTTLLSYSTGTKELVPPTLKLAGSYQWDIANNGDHILLPAIDVDLRFENLGSSSEVHLGPISSDFHFGLEYKLKKMVMLRVGYNDLKMFTLGAGIHLPRLTIDYAFQSFSAQDQLGNTHRISFSLSLEEAKWRRKD